ncbi:MarR family winged helix-turn-helix transcriptional regulator [Devosia sp. Root635]|uniref:MarR family winged helix-turn-helix transcriptional regulator n=1 Tax=Devosia sp. Root635 TaxID=1736575 RepID=UPI0006F55A63|nr:MarR family winged helix-turn-helix transcriptional regulator [Devosia sp. Root635]KRA43260.1 MarR family transcriptional regulator [Devosia sp. Root635]
MSTDNALVEQDDAEGGLNSQAALGLIGYRLRRAQLSVFQRFLTVFESLALRPAEYSVLVLVDENPGRKQSEIAAALGIKRANFVALAQGLEARGLLERLSVESDRRANALHLTASGRIFLAEARDLHDQLESDFVERLGGESQREQLLALLERLT